MELEFKQWLIESEIDEGIMSRLGAGLKNTASYLGGGVKDVAKGAAKGLGGLAQTAYGAYKLPMSAVEKNSDAVGTMGKGIKNVFSGGKDVIKGVGKGLWGASGGAGIAGYNKQAGIEDAQNKRGMGIPIRMNYPTAQPVPGQKGMPKANPVKKGPPPLPQMGEDEIVKRIMDIANKNNGKLPKVYRGAYEALKKRGYKFTTTQDGMIMPVKPMGRPKDNDKTEVM